MLKKLPESRKNINHLANILAFAGKSEDEIEQIRKDVEEFRNLPDMFSMDNEAYQIRRKITSVFYDIYYQVFMNAVKSKTELTTSVKMFLNFGFLDTQLAGEENVNILYDLARHLEVCNSESVYTMFYWLKAVYEGKKEPSKNEFDLDSSTAETS